MKKTILIAVLLSGCSLVHADDPLVVPLTAQERTQAQALATRRENVQIKRNEATAAYQGQMNRLQEEEAQINNEEAKFCLQLKRAHELGVQTNYRIEEWQGQLVKVH